MIYVTAEVPVGVTLVAESIDTADYKRRLMLARNRDVLWNDDDKNLMLRGEDIVEGTHVLKHNSTATDMASQAEDASADLVNAERCRAAGVEYVKNVAGYCGGHKHNNIWQPSQKALSDWVESMLGAAEVNELGGMLLFRAKKELGIFFGTRLSLSGER